jgi:hypothetical protein
MVGRLSLIQSSLHTTLCAATSADSLGRSSNAIGCHSWAQPARLKRIPRRAAAFEEKYLGDSQWPQYRRLDAFGLPLVRFG